MRKSIPLEKWQFTIGGAKPAQVQVPHTWNAQDGQDGGDDYLRGEGVYTCRFDGGLCAGRQVYAVFEGANHTASVWCNGALAGTHRGGFSRFVLDITGLLGEGENELRVAVDNSFTPEVYPQQADFTFFGGLYRPVYLLLVSPAHFAPGKYGGNGVRITCVPEGGVAIEATVTGGSRLVAEIVDADGKTVCSNEGAVTGTRQALALRVERPRLWNGVQDPYLYTCRLVLKNGGTPADCIEVPFGFRSFAVDKKQGFLLNGRPYSLRGVSMHQDRQDMGWAVGAPQQQEDMALVREIGANTLRLAHYQHAQQVYDSCDRLGLVVWAEIPFITLFSPAARAVENTKTQLLELIEQNHNHPCICFWGLANELGIGGETPALLENLRELNRLAHEADGTRPTAIANLGSTKPQSGLAQAADLLGFNKYLGWYEGEAGDIGPYLDGLHQSFDKPVALTEYGAEALPTWHSEAPKKQDYTEEYQALVHEAALAALQARPWVWASWVWSMFDFASDRRDEGGCRGRNNKGLVTYDRRVKKDAFYLYKAFWGSQPFVYITGRRFRQRTAERVCIKVYSNCGPVTLRVNDGPDRTREGERVFVFEDVALAPGENRLVATAGQQQDSITLLQTASPSESYTLPATEKRINQDVAQWFAGLQPKSRRLEIREGYLSVEDTVDAILAYPAGAKALQRYLFGPLGAGGAGMAAGSQGGSLKVSSIWRHLQSQLPDSALLLLNEALGQIKK